MNPVCVGTLVKIAESRGIAIVLEAAPVPEFLLLKSPEPEAYDLPLLRKDKTPKPWKGPRRRKRDGKKGGGKG